MIELEEARALLLKDIGPLGEEEVPLDKAAGRVLARDVRATHSQPPEPRSRMDGIAVPDWSTTAGATFKLIGESSAGSPFADELGGRQAVRISTGAVVPPGGARVIEQEIVNFEVEGLATLLATPGEDSFIRPPGSDFHEGELLLSGGARLHPGALTLLAAANRSSAHVYTKARVAVLTSGDELVAPGTELSRGATIDSASYAIAALVDEWGAVPRQLGIVPDDAREVQAALADALEQFDLVVTIGGASVGAHDHFRNAGRALGMELPFEKIAVQPGKPTWHARGTPSRLCLGLPGNPASAFVCAHLLLKPLLRRLHGCEDAAAQPTTALLAGRGITTGSRRTFERGRLSAEHGMLYVQPAENQDSGLQSVLAAANCLIDIPASSHVSTGDAVKIVHLADWDGKDRRNPPES